MPPSLGGGPQPSSITINNGISASGKNPGSGAATTLAASSAAAAVAAAARLNGLMRSSAASPPKPPQEATLLATNKRLSIERRGSTSPPATSNTPIGNGNAPPSLLPGLLASKNPLQERLAEQMLRNIDHQSALINPAAHQVIFEFRGFRSL